uniref:Transmembrane and coiled-coil domains protein 1 n=1 Tax=Culex pipiens TaxID=7175 RepID=A0A8D8EA61_CULPI
MLHSSKSVSHPSAGSKHSSRESSPHRTSIHEQLKQAGAMKVESPLQRTFAESREMEEAMGFEGSGGGGHHDAHKDSEETDGLSGQMDENDGGLTTISQLSNDSGDKLFEKGHHRTSSSLAHNRIITKIACTKESIKKEQTTRDANVNEYLKLAASADKQQLQRIKAVFEKKNQKSAHNISQLQKKLESYSKRYKDLQYHQSQKQQQSHRQPREMLRDVGQGLRNVGGNIRDGVSGLSATVMSKPREFAHLIKNKFGSADNINQLAANHNVIEMNRDLTASNIDDSVSFHYDNLSSSNVGIHGVCLDPADTRVISNTRIVEDASGKYSEHESECSSVTSDSIPLSSGKHRRLRSQHCTNYKAMGDIRDGYDRMKTKLERLELMHKDVTDLAIALETERYRTERLEEQVNDLTELHQNEIENLKQAIADLEEKVQYQSDERLRDVYEIMENCQTRVSKMEHLSQQQYVTIEGIDNSNARAVVVKLINVVLTVLQVILLLVATAAGITMPFLRTRIRVLTTVVCIVMLAFMVRQWTDIISGFSYLVQKLGIYFQSE